MRAPLDVVYDFGHLRPDTDPAMVLPALEVDREPRIDRLQFDQPLPEEVLDAAAAALERHPEVALRAFGDGGVDPSLEWLSRFPKLRRLSVELFTVESFAPIAHLTALREVHVGATRSSRPSLDFVAGLPDLVELSFEGHGAKGFEAVAGAERLTTLRVRKPKMKSLDPLAGHGSVEVVTMALGGLTDLTPLATLPRLREVDLLEVRGLGGRDLDALSGCAALTRLGLFALRGVDDLGALGGGPVVESLEALTLDRLGALQTLDPLAACSNLRELSIVDARPADRDLAPLHGLTSLRRVFLGDAYPASQLRALRDATGPGVVNHRGQVLT